MKKLLQLRVRQKPDFRWVIATMFVMSVLFGIFSVVFQMYPDKEVQATTTENIPSGSFIVNMGITPQTNNNALKPYGMVYDLIKNYNVPVKWVVNPAKTRDGIDFTYNSVNYRGSAFIISTEYLTTVVKNRITYWQGQGIVGVYATSNLSVPVYATITSFPLVMIDALSSNQQIIINYYNNAGIPSSAYTIGTPSGLTQCYDVWTNPHGDPTWATHSYLYDFVTVNKSWIWAECHSVSMMEYCRNGSQQLNFLTSNGLKCWGAGKCGTNPESHTKNPSAPYTYFYPTEPVMQFIGNAHNASLDGSEQWYQPLSTGQWNTNTRRGITTGTGSSPKEGSLLVYGPAFNDPSNGWIMYQGGHDLNAGGNSATDRVAAQRAYFNFILLAGKTKQVNVTATLPTNMNVGQVSTVSSSATSGSPPYTYTWTSSLGGNFANNTDSNTIYTAPVVLQDTFDVVQIRVTDQCGRVNFYTQQIHIGSSPLPVSLLNFSGYKKNKLVYLLWSSASEINNDYYSIERSENGSSWKMIGKVKGAGNSSNTREYAFTDTEPLNSPAYYRLSQTDYDGTSKGFRVIRIGNSTERAEKTNRLNISPNPFSESFSFEVISDEIQNAELILFDADGDVVLKNEYVLQPGKNQLYYSNKDHLTDGIYYVTLKTETNRLITSKVIKQ